MDIENYTKLSNTPHYQEPCILNHKLKTLPIYELWQKLWNKEHTKIVIYSRLNYGHLHTRCGSTWCEEADQDQTEFTLGPTWPE